MLPSCRAEARRPRLHTCDNESSSSSIVQGRTFGVAARLAEGHRAGYAGATSGRRAARHCKRALRPAVEPRQPETQSARVEPECRESRLLREHHVHILDRMALILSAEGIVDRIV